MSFGYTKDGSGVAVDVDADDEMIPTNSQEGEEPSLNRVYSKMYVHRAVWTAFNGPVPSGMDIMIDNNAPLTDEGYYRNWLCDLSIGTRSENMRSTAAATRVRAMNGGSRADAMPPPAPFTPPTSVAVTTRAFTSTDLIPVPAIDAVLRVVREADGAIKGLYLFDADPRVSDAFSECGLDELSATFSSDFKDKFPRVRAAIGTKKKMNTNDFVWSVLLGRTVADGLKLAAFNKCNGDLRMANLVQVPAATGSKIAVPAALSDELQEMLGVKYLPSRVTIYKERCGERVVDKFLINNGAKNKPRVAVSRETLEQEVSTLLLSWYASQQPPLDFATEHATYVKLLDEYLTACALAR